MPDLDDFKWSYQFKFGFAVNAVVGTWAIHTDASQYLNGWYIDDSHALNDQVQYKFSHKAGSFTFKLLTATTPGGGIVTVYVDGVSQGTINVYTVGTVYNVTKTLAVAIAKDGEHTLTIKVTAAGAGGDFYVRLSAWWLTD